MMTQLPMTRRRGGTIEVRCFVDVARTPETLHAHAIPEGIEIHPGDTVRVHGAPSGVRYGEQMRMDCMATVTRASAFRRAWTRFTAVFALVELFETGFQPKEHA
jgi:hypothetical protein